MIKNGFEVLEEDEFKGGSYQLPLTVPTGGGSINFVTQNVGIRGRAEQILAVLRGAVESGCRLEEVEVDSMLIEGVEKSEDGDEPFRTYGFASAAGGVGQRFYSKYYSDQDPNPRTIVKVIGQTIASMPVALSPLRYLPALPRELREYAREVFEPCRARVTVDGMVLPHTQFTGLNIASMSINLGGVVRLFGKADEPGHMHCLVGSPSPLSIVRNLPNMHLGRTINARGLLDRVCREMTVEAAEDELLEPVIDGEYYRNIKRINFRLGPRVRIPKVVGAAQ
jgi:hypothetical protein